MVQFCAKMASGLMEEPLDSFVVDALRAEKVLAVAAGDNVVRLLPPLIVSEAEIGEAIARLDRAATALEHAAEKAQVAQEATG